MSKVESTQHNDKSAELLQVHRGESDPCGESAMQRAEEAYPFCESDIAEHNGMGIASTLRDRKIWLAGRADVYEHDLKGKLVLTEERLRELLEMARDCYMSGMPTLDNATIIFSYPLSQITNKAKEG